MKKIVIYIDNRKFSQVDCSDMLAGNPGIGGTEYCILLLAQVLQQYKNDYSVILFCEKQALFPVTERTVIVDGLEDIAQKYINIDGDILIMSSRRDGEPLPQSFFDLIDKLDIKCILWGHNYYYSDYCKRIARCNAIKANVFVGKQQYDRYIDNCIIDKSVYIYNMYPTVDKISRGTCFFKTVTYIGSLVPSKGFHVLASVWKDILKRVPDAQLYVIGSGHLYNRDSKLGKFNIAEESYENSFIEGLLDENGCILDSVHFWGVLGHEKDEIIRNTSVGIVNPTGNTETFGISALDFESVGVPVVTVAKGGFLDTIIHNETGLLFRRKTEFVEDVVFLLNDTERNEELGANGIVYSDEFSPEIIIQKWYELFGIVLNSKSIKIEMPNNFINTNLKWLRVINYKVKRFLRYSHGPSIVGLESIVASLLRRLKH